MDQKTIISYDFERYFGDESKFKKSVRVEGIVRISNMHHKGAHLFIKGCTFGNDLFIISSSFEAEISFTDCTFEGDFRVESGTFSSLSFLECRFENSFVVRSGTFTDSLLFGSTSNTGPVYISGSEINKLQFLPRFDGDEIFYGEGERLGVSGGKISLLTVSVKGFREVNFNGGIIDKVNFQHGSYQTIILAGACVHNFNISNTDEYVENSSVSVDQIELAGILYDSTVSINNISLKSFVAKGLVNRSHVVLNNVGFPDEAEIHFEKSDLGNMVFNTTDFTNSNLFVSKSRLDNAIFEGVKWPAISRINMRQSSERDRLADIQSFCRSLKASYARRLDAIEAQFWLAEEMKVYSRLIAKISFFNKIQDLIIIGVARFSSNFGQSILRPLLLLLLFHCLWSIGIWGSSDLSLVCPKDFASFYFFSLLPTHSIEYGQKNIAGFYDFMSRISSSFFMYHFVVSSRRYAKKL